MTQKNLKNLKSIKLVITDVDGVLTDGGMYYSETGKIFKKFNTKDGMGVEILHNLGIKTIFLTRENSKIAKLRAKKVNADSCYVNIKNKSSILKKICREFHVKPENIGYIGDDLKSNIKNCINLDRTKCQEYTKKFNWKECSRVFYDNIIA